MSVRESFCDKMGAEESSAAGHENPHEASVKTKTKASKRRTILKLSSLGFAVFAVSFVATLAIRIVPELTRPKYVDPAFRIPSPLELASLPTATRFAFPLGNENRALAYNDQHFPQNNHLGCGSNGPAVVSHR